jgi:hypothetical protein
MRTADCATFAMRLEIEAAARGASERIGTRDRVHRTEWRNGFSRGRAFEGEFSDVTRSYAGKGVGRYQG